MYKSNPVKFCKMKPRSGPNFLHHDVRVMLFLLKVSLQKTKDSFLHIASDLFSLRSKSLIFVLLDWLFCFSWFESPSGAFWQPQVDCYVPFTEQWLLSGHCTMVVLGRPSGRCSSVQRTMLELCQRDHQVLGHFPDEGPSLQSLRFARRPALGRDLVTPNFPH